jgi:hypothetical protein
MLELYKKMYAALVVRVDRSISSLLSIAIQEPCSREQILNAAEELRQALAEAEDMYLDGTEAEQQIN